ncbi:MAG: hypothetical protein LBJ67_09370 [Planctomycetaceae bacterium]|nr:hypothetical protein [Planctomycetaceae bacterium]
MNPSEMEQLERQLAALKPIKNHELVEKIMLFTEEKTRQELENPAGFPQSLSEYSCFPDFSQTTDTANHASRFTSVLPILTGFAGIIFGAAITLFIVTFIIPPQVTVREIVRVVPAENSTQKNSAIQTAASPSDSRSISDSYHHITVKHEKFSSPEILPQPEPPIFPAWLAAVLESFVPERFFLSVQQDAIAMNQSIDIDAMLKRHEEISKHAAYSEPRVMLLRHAVNKTPDTLSPLTFRETLRELCL